MLCHFHPMLRDVPKMLSPFEKYLSTGQKSFLSKQKAGNELLQRDNLCFRDG